jgi:hypothetical protein
MENGMVAVREYRQRFPNHGVPHRNVFYTLHTQVLRPVPFHEQMQNLTWKAMYSALFSETLITSVRRISVGA